MANVFIPRDQDARYIEDRSEFYIVSQVDTKNYIRNGGFEIGQDFWGFALDGWLETGKYGGHAARIPSGNVLWQTLESPTDGSITGYQRCYLTFDAKSASGATASLTVQMAASYGGGTLSSKITTVTLGEWTQIQFNYVPTGITHVLRFTCTGDVLVDNICVTSTPIDLHIPMPQAAALKIFDLSSQQPPYVAAPGLMLKMTPLSDYGFVMSSVVGLGYENPQNNTITLPTGEDRLLSSTPVAKDFSITGSITDASSANLDRKKAALIAAISGKGTSFVLGHRRSKCDQWIGDWGFIQCTYTGGLGIQRTTNYSQDISLDFRQLDPLIYYAPSSLNVKTLGALASTNDPAVPVTFSYDRYAFRYKNQPYRSARTTGSGTLYSLVEGGAVEDAEGNLWVWGKPADVLAYQNSVTPSATSRYIYRLYKGSGYPTAFAVTHGLQADVNGIIPMKNGDVLIYGKFSAPATGICLWSSRTGSLTTIGAMTSSNANVEITRVRAEGTRLWFTTTANVTFGGVSAGSDFTCASSVFYTDTFFNTATGINSNAYFGDTSSNPRPQIETDDSGNVYLRMLTSVGGVGDDRVIVSKLTYNEAGTPAFSPMAYLDENSTHSTESYVVDNLIKRAKGVGVPYAFYAQGSSSYTPYVLEISDIQNQRVVQVPDNSLTGDPSNAHLAFTDKFGNTHGWSPQETALYGGRTNFTYKNRLLSGSVEYSADGKLLPSVARRMYASENWELVRESYNNPYRTLPIQTTITNPSSVRLSPIIRFVGGGAITYVGRIINETNGSSLAISGTLRPGEELSFDPMDPFLPEDFVLLENRGPSGVFTLDPGVNSIVTQVNTLWAPYTTSLSLAWANAIRHVELENLYTYRFTGRIRFSVTGGTMTIQSRHSSTSGNYSFNLATASTTAVATPNSSVRVLSAAAAGGSTVSGHVIVYEATYSGGLTDDLFVPLVEMIVPTSALTIEKGTI